jgi:hypothetical protein
MFKIAENTWQLFVDAKLDNLQTPVIRYFALLAAAIFIMILHVVTVMTRKLVKVKLVSVGEFFKQTGIKSVGLMKVSECLGLIVGLLLLLSRLGACLVCVHQLDVEGSELDILEGMTDDDWTRVDQVPVCVDSSLLSHHQRFQVYHISVLMLYSL